MSSRTEGCFPRAQVTSHLCVHIPLNPHHSILKFKGHLRIFHEQCPVLISHLKYSSGMYMAGI